LPYTGIFGERRGRGVDKEGRGWEDAGVTGPRRKGAAVITKQTVLVLGAGASAPYGYPVGEELYDHVIRELRSPSSLLRMFLCTLASDAQLDILGHDLLYSRPSSIDAFLERRPELVEVGKAAIAYVLIQKENLDALFPVVRGEEFRKNDWYWRLWSVMSGDFESFGENALGVITFNYDRSLEQFLFTALKNLHNKRDSQCAEQIARIPIIHVHGSLGPLPWQPGGGRHYQATENDRVIRESAASIEIIPHKASENPAFAKARELLPKADRVYFMGFGFHPKNIERLHLEKCEPRVVVGGTVLGLTAKESNEAQKGINKYLRSPRTRHVLRNENCRAFLRGWAELD